MDGYRDATQELTRSSQLNSEPVNDIDTAVVWIY